MRKAIRTVLILILIAAILGAGWYFLIYRSDISAKLYLAYADLCADHGRYETAAKYYGKAASGDPSDLDLCTLASEAYEQCGNYTKAEYYLNLALQYHSSSLDTYLALSALYVREDKLLDAGQLISGCTDSTIKSELESIRPASPLIQPGDLYYTDPVECVLSFSGGTAYVSLTNEYPSTETDLYTGSFSIDYGVTEISAVVVGENGLVSKLTQETYTVCGEIKEAVFEDEAFEELIRDELGKHSYDSISTYELWQIHELVIPENVENLSDASMLLGLETLTLYGNKTNLSVLSTLPKLQSLSVEAMTLSSDDITGIAGCSGLASLSLPECGISDISAFASLQSLTVLDLSGNNLKDITALAGISGLQELYLQNNSIDSLSAAAALPLLEVLNVSGNRITGLGALSSCNALRELYASGCAISDLSLLNGKSSLTILELSANRIVDISALSGCPALESLDISSNNIEDVTPLTSLTSLKTLIASDNQISECPVFPSSCGLLSVDFSDNLLSSVDGLSSLNALHTIIVDRNNITSLDAVAELPSLVRVDAYENPLLSVEALESHSIVVSYDLDYADRFSEEENEESADADETDSGSSTENQ